MKEWNYGLNVEGGQAGRGKEVMENWPEVITTEEYLKEAEEGESFKKEGGDEADKN